MLDKDELPKMAQSQTPMGGGRPGGPPEGGPARVDAVFAALDTDHDGTLSGMEIANAPMALKTLDKNGDGKITEDEVRPSFPGGGGPGMQGGRGPGGDPAQFVNRIFEQSDKNGDGKLSKDEMPERMLEMFDRADENKDGFLSREELTNAMLQGGRGRQRQ